MALLGGGGGRPMRLLIRKIEEMRKKNFFATKNFRDAAREKYEN
jgi:hypothetical protein